MRGCEPAKARSVGIYGKSGRPDRLLGKLSASRGGGGAADWTGFPGPTLGCGDQARHLSPGEVLFLGSVGFAATARCRRCSTGPLSTDCCGRRGLSLAGPMYAKCMQKFCDRVDSVGSGRWAGRVSPGHGTGWTPPTAAGPWISFWGSRGREFKSLQPDGNSPLGEFLRVALQLVKTAGQRPANHLLSGAGATTRRLGGARSRSSERSRRARRRRCSPSRKWVRLPARRWKTSWRLSPPDSSDVSQEPKVRSSSKQSKSCPKRRPPSPLYTSQAHSPNAANGSTSHQPPPARLSLIPEPSGFAGGCGPPPSRSVRSRKRSRTTCTTTSTLWPTNTDPTPSPAPETVDPHRFILGVAAAGEVRSSQPSLGGYHAASVAARK